MSRGAKACIASGAITLLFVLAGNFGENVAQYPLVNLLVGPAGDFYREASRFEGQLATIAIIFIVFAGFIYLGVSSSKKEKTAGGPTQG